MIALEVTFLRAMVMTLCLAVLPALAAPELAQAQSSLKKCPKDLSASWHNCFGKWSDGKGFTYEGEWRNNKQNGRGYAEYASGEKYDGEFKDDKRNGQGIYWWPTGQKYIGEYKNDLRSGRGTQIYPDGNAYVGEFRNDKANGQGTFIYASGDEYSGEFNDWLFDGHISVTYVNGDSYSGLYRSDKREGDGTYIWRDGSKYVGQWKDGLPVASGRLTNASGAVIDGARFSTSAGYDSDGALTSPDVLTYVGGSIQQQITEQQGSVMRESDIRRVALVIGNSSYRHATTLRNPRNDAEAMTALLKKIGFEVLSGTDLDKRQTEQKIAEFVDRAAQADVSLFFYAGHGIQVLGENFIVPIDAKVEKPSAIDFELVNVSMVTNYMGGDKSVGIALLDACRDNPFARSLSRALGTRSFQVGSGLAELRSDGGGLLVGFATAPGSVADDGVGLKNSPFTTALLNHLGSKGLEIELLLKRVKADVYDATKGKQQPWHNSALRTEVYLAGE